MTASEILNVIVTVAVIQAGCDLLAYWRIFRQEPYQRALEKRERALFRKTKAQKEADAIAKETTETSETNKSKSTTTTTSSSKNKPTGKAARTAKALERAEQDLNDVNAVVAQFFFLPNILTSIIFVVVMRVMGMEHQGKIMGGLPFVPFRFLHRITGRGLDFGETATATFEAAADEKADVRSTLQAFSFVFVYLLTGLSVKFYVSRLVGVNTPGTSYICHCDCTCMHAFIFLLTD